MKLRNIKNFLKFLSKTPFHPQWILTRHAHKNYLGIATEVYEEVLDIGSAEQAIKNYLKKGTRYIGLDYYSTAKYWYGCVPDIYGDAKALPIDSNSISTVLMLDVLEHLPYPSKCISEVARVLKPGGKIIMQTPFLYPLHDQPLDYTRWTEYGYEKLLEESGLKIIDIKRTGKPIETACLMLNIALCKALIDSVNRRKLVAIILIFVPFIVPIVNLICWFINPFCTDDNFMPLNYRVMAIKNTHKTDN